MPVRMAFTDAPNSCWIIPIAVPSSAVPCSAPVFLQASGISLRLRRQSRSTKFLPGRLQCDLNLVTQSLQSGKFIANNRLEGLVQSVSEMAQGLPFKFG